MSDASDVELMKRVRDGDHEAFETIVDRHKHQLVNYLTHLTGTRDRAEDYAQEAFVRLFESAGRYEEKGSMAGYLFRIATNLVRSDLRRFLRWRALLPFIAPAGEESQASSPQRDVILDELRSRLTAAIAALPLQFRAPLVLSEIEEWSYRQIAEALECDEGTVKSRIHRAKLRLRTELAPYRDGGFVHERRRA